MELDYLGVGIPMFFDFIIWCTYLLFYLFFAFGVIELFLNSNGKFCGPVKNNQS